MVQDRDCEGTLCAPIVTFTTTSLVVPERPDMVRAFALPGEVVVKVSKQIGAPRRLAVPELDINASQPVNYKLLPA